MSSIEYGVTGGLTQHKKGLLEKVLGSCGDPVIIQDWLESEYSIYLEEWVDQGTAYGVLVNFFSEEGWDCDYYLFDATLYLLVEERTLDEYGYVEAEVVNKGIRVDALWYNGGGSFSECITDALKKLENEL